MRWMDNIIYKLLNNIYHTFIDTAFQRHLFMYNPAKFLPHDSQLP